MAGIGTASIVTLIGSTGELGGTWGSTGSVASRKLHGISEQSFTITEQAESVPLVGYYGPSPILEEVQKAGEFSLDGVVTYQEMPKIYNGFFTAVGASTGTADPYPFYWSAPVASTQASYTYAAEFGTTGVPYRARGCILNDLKITGEAGSFWKFSAGGFAKVIETLTSGMSTAAFADARAMTPVSMKDTNIRMVPFATGTFGSSSGIVDASLISFELSYNPNRHLKFFAGSANAGGWGDARGEGTLKTVLEFNSTQQALLAELIGSAATSISTGVPLQRQIRLWASATSTAGTTGFVAAIDFAGMVSEPVKLWDDRDGNATIELTWTGKFSSGLTAPGTSGTGNWLACSITNGSSSTT